MVVEINVLANDTDIDNALNPTSVTITAVPVNGSTTINTVNGRVTYTPNSNFTGLDSLGYTVQDVAGATSNQAVVHISVGAVNDAPLAVPDTAFTNSDIPVQIDLVANDSDIDGRRACEWLDDHQYR